MNVWTATVRWADDTEEIDVLAANVDAARVEVLATLATLATDFAPGGKIVRLRRAAYDGCACGICQLRAFTAQGASPIAIGDRVTFRGPTGEFTVEAGASGTVSSVRVLSGGRRRVAVRLDRPFTVWARLATGSTDVTVSQVWATPGDLARFRRG